MAYRVCNKSNLPFKNPETVAKSWILLHNPEKQMHELTEMCSSSILIVPDILLGPLNLASDPIRQKNYNYKIHTCIHKIKK